MKPPLAYQMRPQKLQDVIGQEHLTDVDKPLYQIVESQTLQSMILFGPPGTGKTSLANVLANEFKLPIRKFNAATDTKQDLQTIINESKIYQNLILLLDEIHRLDKPKQDFLLPLIEKGQIVIIGATTENPYLSINPAIRSRVHLFELYPLSHTSMIKIMENALQDKKNGLGTFEVQYTQEVLLWICKHSNGDIRYALNNLELAVKSQQKQDQIILSIDKLESLFQNQNIIIDQDGNEHYNLLSALQKSIRGSDVDAALHYLARLIKGRDLESLFRRLIVIAYEDIGLANPQVPVRVMTAIQTCKMIGLPEAKIPLANVVIDLCLSPKSNSSLTSINNALQDLDNYPNPQIPKHLQDNHFKDTPQSDYLYPHDYPDGFVHQQYLPDKLINHTYYQPKETGKYERALSYRYQQLKTKK